MGGAGGLRVVATGPDVLAGAGPVDVGQVAPGAPAGASYSPAPVAAPGRMGVPGPAENLQDFADLFRAHYGRATAALRLAGAGADSEDIAQEAFARTLGHWRRVRTGTNPAGYVYRTAFRLHWKRAGLANRETSGDASPPLLATTEETVVESLSLAGALSRLPPRRRACAVACWVIGLTPVEAAGALGIAASTVRKQLDSAREDLARWTGTDSAN
ncbi:MAG: RNA polymerase sigma factor [Acidimicrobiales bacterium]